MCIYIYIFIYTATHVYIHGSGGPGLEPCWKVQWVSYAKLVWGRLFMKAFI